MMSSCYILTQAPCGSAQIRFLTRPPLWAAAVFTLLTLVWIRIREEGANVGGRSVTPGFDSRVQGYKLPVKHTFSNPAIPDRRFEEALASIAKNKTIILAMVDDSQELPVRNFYQYSILPLGLFNTLFVSTSSNGCHRLLALHIPCVVFGNYPDGAALFNTKKFLAKMNVRTNYTLRALELGYSILQTDTDVIYYKDPFPYFNCTTCHFEAIENGLANFMNAGFLYIRSNNVTIDVYRAMVNMSIRAPKSEDQSNLNRIVRRKKVAYRVLNNKQFLCGKDYYLKPKRHFISSARECPECVVVHNNYIVSTEAKVRHIVELLFNIKIITQTKISSEGQYFRFSCLTRYRDSICKDRTAVRPYYLNNVYISTDKKTSFS